MWFSGCYSLLSACRCCALCVHCLSLLVVSVLLLVVCSLVVYWFIGSLVAKCLIVHLVVVQWLLVVGYWLLCVIGCWWLFSYCFSFLSVFSPFARTLVP